MATGLTHSGTKYFHSLFQQPEILHRQITRVVGIQKTNT